METNNVIETIIKELDRRKLDIEWGRFNSCNAYIGNTQYIECEGTTYKVIPIKSYHTVVGYYDVNEDVAYEYGKYSSTTSKQFTQICNQRLGHPKRVLVNVSTGGRY